MRELKAASGSSQCLFGERETVTQAWMTVTLDWAAVNQNATMNSRRTRNGSLTSQILAGAQKITYLSCLVFSPSRDQPQSDDKTSQTTFVDLVEVVLSAYHQ